MSTWLELLETQNPSALAAICDLMARHVTAQRLDLPQTITLANVAATPVANLTLEFLCARTFAASEERQALSDVAARCEAVAPALTSFALSILRSKEHGDMALVSRFFDALLAPPRAAAWAWLAPESATSPGSPAKWSTTTSTQPNP